jgi:hypothetical protein
MAAAGLRSAAAPAGGRLPRTPTAGRAEHRKLALHLLALALGTGHGFLVGKEDLLEFTRACAAGVFVYGHGR